MIRRTLSEYGSVELELRQEDAVRLRREFDKKLTVVPTMTPGRYEITAGCHVGTVVGPGFELRIRPKCGTHNLFYLLTHAYRLADIRRDLVGHEEVDDIREFLLKILAGRIQDLMRLGLRRDYVERRRDLRVLRGRLQIAQHIRRALERPLDLPCEYEEFTADVIHNRILRYTIRRVMPPSDQETFGRLQRIERALSIVSHVRADRPRSTPFRTTG